MKNVEIHPTSLSFSTMLTKARQFASHCVKEAVNYNKTRWDKTHKEPNFKVGEKVLLSTINFTNLQGPKKLQDSFVGPFVIKKLIGKNALELILTEEFDRKHPVFPVSLIKKFKENEDSKFKSRTKQTEKPIVFEPEEDKEILKIIGQKRIRDINNKDKVLYLVRYKKNNSDKDEWLPEELIPDSKKNLRNFRASKRGNPHQFQ